MKQILKQNLAKIKRPILVAVIGYVLGIIEGLYLSFSVGLFYVPILVFWGVFYKFNKQNYKNNKNNKLKLFSPKRYLRYFKLYLTPQAIVIILMFSTISNTVVLCENTKYINQRSLINSEEQLNFKAIVCSDKNSKEYQDIFKIKIQDNKKYKNRYFYLSISTKQNVNLQYGDEIKLTGIYSPPEVKRNYGGFDYSEYLKQQKIIGTIKAQDVVVLKNKQANFLLQMSNNFSHAVKERLSSFLDEDKSALLIGILLGDVSGIDEDIKEGFRNCNLSHILAVSGMHVTYIILGVQKLLKSILGRRTSYIVSICVVIAYLFLTGFTPSIVRASIMSICLLGAKILYRKNDFWTSTAISLWFILLNNPFSIQNIGLQFSYMGMIGIVVGSKVFRSLFHQISYKRTKRRRKSGKYYFNRKRAVVFSRLQTKIQEMIMVTLSAQIAILPVMLFNYNQFSLYFLITNVLVGFLIGPIVLFGFLLIIFSILPSFLFKFFLPSISLFMPILKLMLVALLQITKIGNLPFAKIYVATPNIISIGIYYVVCILFKFLYLTFNSKKLTPTKIRVKNLVAVLRYKIHKNKKYVIKFVIGFCTIFLIISIYPQNLKIHFVDVGQGDCTFIETPNKKTILIDGGGSLSKTFSVGEKTLIPYILDRGYTKIDTIIISHFDYDHVEGILKVLQELKVGQVYFPKQQNDSENFIQFLKITKEKKIKTQELKKGDVLKLEKDLTLKVLWPLASKEKMITENAVNNNSLVAKLEYGSFSCLFTGDIEKIAEEEILANIKNVDKDIEATVLKVAHHGSKSSSINEFLTAVKPKIALIGVGKNNKFGHPSDEVIQRLQKNKAKIYRTDFSGEIEMLIFKGGDVKIQTLC